MGALEEVDIARLMHSQDRGATEIGGMLHIRQCSADRINPRLTFRMWDQLPILELQRRAVLRLLLREESFHACSPSISDQIS
jgi:hypothetical protein